MINKIKLNSDLDINILCYSKIDNPTQENLFRLWIDEAILCGFIKKFIPEDELTSYVLFSGLEYNYTEEKILYAGTKKERTKQTIKTDKLLHPTTYTPDGIIIWDESAKGILFDNIYVKGSAYFKAQFIDGDWMSVLDVKAPTGTNRMADLPFSFTRKMLWMAHGIFVNKVMIVPPRPLAKKYLFSDVWTPGRWFITDKMTKERTLAYKADTLIQFLKNRNL